VICAYCILVRCDLVWCAVLCCDVMCSSAIFSDVLECAIVMHGVLSAMWYCVQRFAEMSLVRCDVVWCAVLICRYALMFSDVL